MRKLEINEQEVIDVYEKYENARQTSEVFGCSTQTVYRILEKHDIPRTHRHLKQERISERISNCKTKYCPALVRMLYVAVGHSPADITDITGIPINSVYSIMRTRHKDVFKSRCDAARNADIDAIEREYVNGASCYELGEKYGVNHTTISKWMRKCGHRRGKGGGNSSKGGITSAQKAREKAIERLNANPNVDLLKYGHPSIVRCTKCGFKYRWTRDSWKSIEPCPSCRERERERERADRERMLYERSQQLEAAREWRLSVPRICAECGDPFWSEHSNVAYCCDKCRHRASNRRAAERNRRKGTARGHRHRMRITVTPDTYDRSITLRAVYEKYHGKCCSCGRQTYRTKKYSPLQATLDHIVALANNGTHTWDNVQLLCSECNSMKRDLGQMRLPIAV